MIKINKPKLRNTISSCVVLLTILALSACQKNYRVVEPDFDRSITDYFVEELDDVARAAQLPVLRELELDDPVHEVRIWISFGANILQHFYSIELAQGVQGRLIRHFEHPGSQWTETEYREFADEVFEFCQPLGRYEQIQTCVDSDYVFDWDALYQDLLKLEVWKLPDESEVPKYVHPLFITRVDGTSVVVELKKPGFYRSYRHSYETNVINDKYLYGNKIIGLFDKHSYSTYEPESDE